MIQESILKTLYGQSSFNRNAPLRAIVESLLDKSFLEERLIVQALPNLNIEQAYNQETILEKWRDLLALMLVLREKNSLDSMKSLVLKSIRDLQHFSLYPDHQLLVIYQAIVAFLLNQKSKEFFFVQFSNGACPLEAKGFTTYGEIPHILYHAELGILYCLYGDLTGQSSYIEAAFKLAKWQCCTLDFHAESFVGLFSCEGQASERLLLINNFLLFNAIAKTKNCPDMAFLAEKHVENLSILANRESIDIPSYSVVLEAYFDHKNLPLISKKFLLPPTINDDLLAIAGSRSQECSALATLYGGKSGMGSYHYKEIKVINFGPQHLPLGDCSGFGLEGSQRLLPQQIKVLSTSSKEFILEGTMRMSSNPQEKNLEIPHGGWIESRQEFQEDCLTIKTQFLGLFKQQELFFSFFVKCKNCVVDGEKTIRPRSLNRYLGKVASLKLQGEKSSLLLKAEQNHEEMHVIPLGGGDNFWGADFLIAYLLKGETDQYSWQLSPLIGSACDSSPLL